MTMRIRRVSRRGLLAGLAAAPALTLAAAPGEAQAAAGIEATLAATHAALKDAKGTKLVLLGTGAGPVPGSRRHMTAHLLISNGAAYVLDAASA